MSGYWSDIIPTCQGSVAIWSQGHHKSNIIQHESTMSGGRWDTVYLSNTNIPTILVRRHPDTSPTSSRHARTQSNVTPTKISKLAYGTCFLSFAKLMSGFYQIPTSSRRIHPDILGPTFFRHFSDTIPTFSFVRVC